MLPEPGSAKSFFLLKGSFFLSTVALCMLKMGRLDRRQVSMKSVFLARQLFFNWLCMNWTNLEFTESNFIEL